MPASFFISAFPGPPGRPRKGEVRVKSEMFHVKLPRDFLDELQVVADSLGTNPHDGARWALQEYVNRNHPLNAEMAAEGPIAYSTK